MESMSADVAPESIQADLQCSSPRAGHLEDPRGNSKPHVRGDHLDASNPFRNFTSLVCSEARSIGRVTFIECGELVTSTISQSLGGSEMREEVSVALEDVELFRGCVLVVTSEGPSSS